MKRKCPVLVYVDTSVFGGVFDEEFRKDSIKFFNLVKENYFNIATSSIVKNEIDLASTNVKNLFYSLYNNVSYFEITKEALVLRDEYIKAGILTKKSLSDAMHVAVASVSKVSLIVSWNFKHLVNYKKIPFYNAVNLVNGYSNIGIYSPKEVIENEED